MTIELETPAAGQHHDELVQFVFRAPSAAGLPSRARALLDAAPKELAESFEQAMRASGLVS